MKKLLLIISFVNLLMFKLTAQDLIFVRNKTAWGILDKNLNVLQDCRFKGYRIIKKNPLRIAVRQKRKWGLLNELGKVLRVPQYAWIADMYFTPSLFRVTTADSITYNTVSSVYHNEKQGIIDLQGKSILPLKFNSIGYNHDLHYFITYFGIIKERKNGYPKTYEMPIYYDTLGKQQYTDCNVCQELNLKPVAKGYFMHRSDDTYKWGVIDCDSNIVIPYEFDKIEKAVNGLVKVYKDDRRGSKKYGIYNLKGEVVVKVNYDNLYLYNDFILFEKTKEKMGVAKRNKKIIIPDKYEYIRPEENYFVGRISNKWYAMDTTGKLLYPEGVNHVFFDKRKNLLCLQIDDQNNYVFMNKQGSFSKVHNLGYDSHNLQYDFDTLQGGSIFRQTTYVTKYVKIYTYQYIKKDKQGAIVRQNNKWGYINPDASWLIQPEYDSLLTFSDNLIWAKKNNTWEVLDKQGIKQFEVSEKLSAVKGFSEGFAPIAIGEEKDIFGNLINQKWGYINTQGEIIIPYQFKDAKSFSNGFATVKVPYQDKYIKTYKWTFINQSGKVVKNFYFDEIIYEKDK